MIQVAICDDDELLCQKWGITAEEWEYIDSKISEVDQKNEN